MKEPTTPKELLELHKVLRSDTQRYLQIANEWIRRNPRNSHAYFSRHHAWMEMGEPNRTLEDMNKAIALEPDPISYLSRGEIYRHLGEYQKAIEDFDLGEQLDPKGWQEDVLGCSIEPIATHGSGTKRRRLRIARACPMTSGHLESTTHLPAARRRLRTSCVASRPKRGAGGHNLGAATDPTIAGRDRGSGHRLWRVANWAAASALCRLGKGHWGMVAGAGFEPATFRL